MSKQKSLVSINWLACCLVVLLATLATVYGANTWRDDLSSGHDSSVRTLLGKEGALGAADPAVKATVAGSGSPERAYQVRAPNRCLFLGVLCFARI
jgi:hypothetical protein